MYFFGANSFGKQQKKQVLQALEAGDTDQLLAILSTYEPNADAYNLIDRHEFHTLLTYASCRGHIGIVKMLIETFHVDPEKRDRRDRMTPLMYASLYNEPNLEVVRYLREECSVDIDCVDQNGHTAAMLAEQSENATIFEYLSNPVAASEEKADEVAATDPADVVDTEERDRDRDREREREQEEADEQRIRIASLESALAEANKRCSRLIEENVAADETYKAVQDHVHQIESENKQLQKRLQQAEERRERMQGQWETALSESQDEISRLRRKLMSSNSNESETSKLREECAQMRRNLALAHDQITLMKQQVEHRAAEANRSESAYEAELSELRAALAEKDLEIGRERERARQKKEPENKDMDEDDFVVIEPPEEPIRS